MALLSPEALASLRDLVAQNALPETVQVQRATRTPDGAGGSLVTWATIATVAGVIRMRDLNPEERALAGATRVELVWTVDLPHGTDVRAADRLIIGGVTYEVAAAVATRSYEVVLRVVVVRIGG